MYLGTSFAFILPMNQTTTPATDPDIITDPVESAKAAGLRYVNTKKQRPGIRREKAGDEFRYIAPDGAVIDDPDKLKRIKALAIPPAWTNVWISADHRGHI